MSAWKSLYEIPDLLTLCRENVPTAATLGVVWAHSGAPPIPAEPNRSVIFQQLLLYLGDGWWFFVCVEDRDENRRRSS
jgi:hypothetical protein